MGKYAVIGNPVLHSISPWIHEKFAQQTHIDLSYEALEIIAASKEDLQQQVLELCSCGYAGINVTVPYKTWMFELIKEKDGLSKRALQAGAVNAVSLLSPAEWLGDNTDGIGLIRDLKKNLAWPIKGMNILLLGAGGAIRGVLPNLVAESPKSIDLLNRNKEKAELLVAKLANLTDLLKPLNDIDSAKHYDIVINGTSSSLKHELPSTIEGITAKNARFYDMVYVGFDRNHPTIFLEWAIANGALAVSNGLGMLLEQAAEAFYQWHHKMPDVSALITAKN